MEKEDNSFLSGILGLLLGLYILSTQIMAIYFWWRYLKEDNFVVAMFIDPFLAELKGIVWPFFI